MNQIRNLGKKALLAAAVAAAVVAPSAQATNGYVLHGFGTAQKGMAGAGSALPLDSMIVYSNPAGLTKLGKRFDLELSFFNPSDRSYTANDDYTPPRSPFDPGFVTPGTYKSENDWFVIPSIGMNWRLDDKSALALTLAGSGGMNTEYKEPVFGNFAFPAGTPPIPAGALGPGSPPLPGNPNGEYSVSGNTGVNLQQALIALSYARDLNENNTIAISPILAIQSIEVKGLQPFTQPQFTVNPAKVTNNGTDYSYGGGIRIGWLGTFADERVNVGVSYQTKLWMTDFKDYEGLFAKGGNFDIPAQLNVGLAFKPIPKLSVALDWQRIFYGQIDSLNNTNATFDFTNPEARLGGDDGLGFGWDSINVFKIGANYEVNDKLSVRAGYSHSDAPFDAAEALFNILAPATIEDHVSVGFSYKFNENHGLSFAYTRALDNKINGQNPQFTGTQTGNVRMEQNIIDLAWNYNF